MKNRILLALYWIAAQLPASTSPGGKVWRKLRSLSAAPLFQEAGLDINIEHGASFGRGHQIKVGDRSGLGINCRLHGPISVGKDVMMGPEVLIYARDHKFSDTLVPMIEQGYSEPREVIIEDDVWIGARAVILSGVRIGTGSIVAAQAVVTKNIEPFSVVAGNPAKVVRKRI